jgi:hypothetical protein
MIIGVELRSKILAVSLKGLGAKTNLLAVNRQSVSIQIIIERLLGTLITEYG